MIKNPKPWQLALDSIFILLSILILSDFVGPGQLYKTEILEVNKTRQDYYNAGGNYHYTYKMITEPCSFLVHEDFAKEAQNASLVEFKLSPIFREVNWYKFPYQDSKSFHSLRLASGLVLPILVIIASLIALKYQKRDHILLLILRIIMVGNIVLLSL